MLFTARSDDFVDRLIMLPSWAFPISGFGSGVCNGTPQRPCVKKRPSYGPAVQDPACNVQQHVAGTGVLYFTALVHHLPYSEQAFGRLPLQTGLLYTERN